MALHIYTMNKFFFSFFFCLVFQISSAQTFEIQAITNAASIDVQMRCTGGSCPQSGSNFVLDLVFGLKWPSSINANLGTQTGTYFMGKSDTELTQSSFEFQAFGATNTPYAFPDTWTLNSWITVMSVPINQTGVFQIAEVGFNSTTDLNINIDGVDYTPTIYTASLPLDLLAFDARATNQAINLNWSAASESNLDVYEIQRSTNGLNFSKKESLKAHNNTESISKYDYTDTDVQAGVEYFYRLKIRELDGTFSYSNIRSAQIKGTGSIRIYPNPVATNSTINIDFTALNAGNLEYKVFNSAGALVQHTAFAVQKGLNNLNSALNNLPAGTYTLQFVDEHTVYSEQVIIE